MDVKDEGRGTANVECRISKEFSTPNAQLGAWRIRASFVIRHSSFVIRHSPGFAGAGVPVPTPGVALFR
jgi:hypothetical protein